MKELIDGIIKFHKEKTPEQMQLFQSLGTGQYPHTLFIACCDSRKSVDVFAGAKPGDIFILRNVGNLVPPCSCNDLGTDPTHGTSAASAIEYAVSVLKVKNIVVCGHSECGAMLALYNGQKDLPLHVKSWLKLGIPTLNNFKNNTYQLDTDIKDHNTLSQINVLTQIDHVKTYDVVKNALAKKQIEIRGFWFDIEKADVLAYSSEHKKFEKISKHHRIYP